jgi:hypothetical protein
MTQISMKSECISHFDFYPEVFGVWCLTSLSTIFQLYRGGYPEGNIFTYNIANISKNSDFIK